MPRQPDSLSTESRTILREAKAASSAALPNLSFAPNESTRSVFCPKKLNGCSPNYGVLKRWGRFYDHIECSRWCIALCKVEVLLVFIHVRRGGIAIAYMQAMTKRLSKPKAATSRAGSRSGRRRSQISLSGMAIARNQVCGYAADPGCSRRLLSAHGAVGQREL
jgi:hypothetical protein